MRLLAASKGRPSWPLGDHGAGRLAPTAERTTEAYTDAVRLLATYCEAHGRPLLASELYQPLVTAGFEAIAHYSPAELSVVSDYLRRGRQLHQRHLTRARAMPPAKRPNAS